MFDEAFKTFPVLETERLKLREPVENDSEAIQEYINNRDYMKYIDYPQNASAKDMIKSWKDHEYTAKTMLRWCIALKENNFCIGSIYLYSPSGDDLSGRKMDIGYEISKKHSNKGFATEAIKKVTEFGFNEMGLKRIQARIISENAAAIRAVEKCGFIHEGVLRNSYYFSSVRELKTVIMMACVSSDFIFNKTSYAGASNEELLRDTIKSARESNSGFRREFFDEVIKYVDRAQMTDPQVYNKAGINRTLWYRMRDNKNARTSKRNVLKIALILQLNYWELYYLINLAGYSFIPHNDITDYVIAVCIWNSVYEETKIDELLIENGAEALFSDEC